MFTAYKYVYEWLFVGVVFVCVDGAGYHGFCPETGTEKKSRQPCP